MTQGDHQSRLDSSTTRGFSPGIPVEVAGHLSPEFDLVRRLGGGESSTVYLAREPALHRLVAIKVLQSLAARHPNRVARFQREARALATVSHPNVVSIYRVGDLSPGVPYLVMQYIRGEDLAERIRTAGPIGELRACGILAAVAAALGAVHSHGIVHRDVRPESILCEQGSDRVLLSDFGLVLHLPEAAEGGAERLTTAGHVITDYRFTSPEVLSGGDPSAASDVYSLGVVGYHVLTGSGPYPVSTPAAQARAHLVMEPISLAALGVQVRPELERLLRACLSRNPMSRPGIRETARTLDALSTSGPPVHERSQVAGPSRSFSPPWPEIGAEPLCGMTLLGGLDLRSADGSQISVLSQPKRTALLAYLAAGTGSGLRRRDTLIGMFWPDSVPESGRHSLRQSLYVIRRDLGADVLITRGDEEVGLDGEKFRCDVTVFETLARAGRASEALELYRGDLLPGFYLDNAPEFERWLEVERVRLREMAARLAWQASDAAGAASRPEEGIDWARRAVELDPFDEPALHKLIELLYSAGDRAGALSAYGHFARRLADEYEIEPSAETRRLIDRVRERG